VAFFVLARPPALREHGELIRHLVRHNLNQLDQGYPRMVNITPEAMLRLAGPYPATAQPAGTPDPAGREATSQGTKAK
jgi:hypothetical protein